MSPYKEFSLGLLVVAVGALGAFHYAEAAEPDDALFDVGLGIHRGIYEEGDKLCWDHEGTKMIYLDLFGIIGIECNDEYYDYRGKAQDEEKADVIEL